jgi:rhamnogalacturonan endolyase
MSDHTYFMQAMHENVGYNQPTNVGYYMGSDQTDEEIWAAASKAEADRMAARGVTAITAPTAIAAAPADDAWYNLMGQKVDAPAPGRVYIHGGKKVFVK